MCYVLGKRIIDVTIIYYVFVFFRPFLALFHLGFQLVDMATFLNLI